MGSVPFADPKKSCEIILDRFKELPFWPQLPKRSFPENMYVQFSEGMPGVTLDDKSRSVRIDTAQALEGLEGFYGRFLEDDLESFKISKRMSEGFYAFLDAVKSSGARYKFLKGQVTGPASFGLALTDEKKVSIIYNKELFEALTKLISMKARWQIKKIKELAEGAVIFIDEPYLVSIGSSYVNINIEETMGAINEVAHSIKQEGALAGLHCCGNTDWPVLLRSDIDILSFDAYNFMTQFTLFKKEIREFLKRGGTIAWGIVPTIADDLKGNTVEALLDRFRKAREALGDIGEDGSSLITPSCGVGSLDERDAEKALDYAAQLSHILKEK